MGSTWKIPSLDDFMESLIHEKTKLIQIGALRNSNPYVLTTKGSSKKNKKKNKGKKDQEKKKEAKQNSTYESSSSKESKGKKDNTKCSYCNMGFHLDISCMKNTIDLMAQPLEKHHLEDCILDNALRKNSST
jgi:spore germination cell wall hydrolase CwlJ-like protein